MDDIYVVTSFPWFGWTLFLDDKAVTIFFSFVVSIFGSVYGCALHFNLYFSKYIKIRYFLEDIFKMLIFKENYII